MLALAACEISDGLRPQEVTVGVPDVRGNKQFLRIERDFPHYIDGKWYITVGVIYDDRSGPVLVELPHEADSGANRLWIARENYLLPAGVSS